MTLIIAFDPGETTGVAIVQWSLKTKAAAVRYAFQRGGVGLKGYLMLMQEGMAGPFRTANVCMVCEQFRLYPWKGKAKAWSGLPEVLAQGAIEYVAYTLGAELHYQTPAMMKGLYPDKAPARREMREHGVRVHARDALCHALTHIVRWEGLGTLPELDWTRMKERQET